MKNNDAEIFGICLFVRVCCLQEATEATEKKDYDSKTSSAPRIIEILGDKAEIKKLIIDNNWKKLFANKGWLSVLQLFQDLGSMNGSIEGKIETLKKYFPEETEGYLI